MKGKAIIVMSLVFLCAFSGGSVAADRCTTIQSGEIINGEGKEIGTGYDEWGYNYLSHMFNGKYCDSYRDAAWCQPWKDVDLEMKWNDAWLSNKDCTGDRLLDRHFGFPTYRGSGAWMTNHQKGTYIDDNGRRQHWTYFTKIVAVPLDAVLIGGFWCTADGTIIGLPMWGEFAVVQEVSNDTGTGDHGILYLSPYRAGFGRFSPGK